MVTLTIDQFNDAWFSHLINIGIHPAQALTMLEQFRQHQVSGASEVGFQSRIVLPADHFIIVEVGDSEARPRRASSHASRGVLGIFCRRCFSLSFHPDDVQQRYCARCKQFHS
jgi:uncharacterized lipoprotein YbaY